MRSKERRIRVRVNWPSRTALAMIACSLFAKRGSPAAFEKSRMSLPARIARMTLSRKPK